MTFITFQKQPMMRKVILALIPAFIGSTYFFGWVSVLIVGLSVCTCLLTEWLFVRKGNGKVSEAVFVTGILLGLIMPPTIPPFMVVLGAAFAITFGKMAFGGFGANVFNPAMVGRAFVYITFPVQITNRWISASNFTDFPGGFAVWRYAPIPDYVTAITSATPSHAYKAAADTLPSLWQLFLGNINGAFDYLGERVFIGGGSLGETSALLLLIGGLFLVIKKVAKWRLVVGFLGTYALMQIILHMTVPDLAPPLVYGMLSGGAVLGGFFMVTDPISAPTTNGAQWLYGALIAISTNIIRTFSLFAGGLMFSILIGNMFAPLMDHGVKQFQKGKSS